jgi:hypothetical protein
VRVCVFFLVVVCLLMGCRETDFWNPRIQAGVATKPHPKERERDVLSDAFHVDQIFESMAGPFTRRRIRVVKSMNPELIWLTGFRVDTVDEDGVNPESSEFECHTNLAWTRDGTPFGFNRPRRRTFTLTQGQTDLRLPPGFGIPILSSEPLIFNSQALNLNQPEIDVTIRHRAKIRFVADRDLETPMTPLVVAAAQVMTTLEEEPKLLHIAQPNGTLAEASCSVGERADAGQVVLDRFGRSFTPHWVVKPGRQEARTLVTDQLRIPYDTTIHFIGVHVHPYSVSLELNDLTTGKTVWKSYQQKDPNQLGLAWMDYYSSVEGIPIYGDHAYQLISVYDNPTQQNSSAMAGIYIYYRDKEFGGPPHETAAVDRGEGGRSS